MELQTSYLRDLQEISGRKNWGKLGIRRMAVELQLVLVVLGTEFYILASS